MKSFIWKTEENSFHLIGLECLWVAFSPIKTFTNLTPHLWIIMTLNIIFGQQVLCTRNTLWPSTCRMWLKLSSMFEWRGGWVYFISGIIQCCCVSVPGTGKGKSGNTPSAPSSGSCWLESCAWALSMESQGRALSSCPVPHCSSAPCLGTGMSQGRGEAKENNLPLFSLFSWWSPVTLYIISLNIFVMQYRIWLQLLGLD